MSDEQLLKKLDLLKTKAKAFDNYLSEPADKKIKAAENMENDELAEYVAGVSQGLFLGLVNFKPYIEELWRRFEKIKTDRSDETISGCHTKDEFCEKVLKRTRRAVNYMLTGGNPVSKRRETVSRPDPVNPAPPERETVSLPLLPPPTSHPQDAAALEIQQAKRRRGFVRQNPEYKDKSAEEIDAAIQAKHGTPTLLKGQIPIYQSGASVSSTAENPSVGGGASPTSPLQDSEDAPPQPPAPVSTETLSETFYVIRRKSDGAFYQESPHGNITGKFVTSISSDDFYQDATHYDCELITDEDFNDGALVWAVPDRPDRVGTGKSKRQKLQRHEWEWVKVQAKYELTFTSRCASLRGTPVSSLVSSLVLTLKYCHKHHITFMRYPDGSFRFRKIALDQFMARCTIQGEKAA